MKFQFSQSIDYNQMLVFSVFGHLLLLTSVLFLPQPSLPERAIVPAFMVNLINGSTGFDSAEEKISVPSVRAKKPFRKRVKKKIQASKPMRKRADKKTHPSKSAEVLEALSNLETKMAMPAKKNIVEELNQLARLEKPKHKALATKPNKSVTEETFRELETLKNKKINDIKAVTPELLNEDVLKDFDELKMEESLLEKTTKEAFVSTNESKEKPVFGKKESEKPKGSKVDLLKQLQQLAKFDATHVPEMQTREPQLKKQKARESFDSIINKLGSLSVESEPVRVELSISRFENSNFQSQLRSLPKTSRTSTKFGAGDANFYSSKEVTSIKDVQSLYVGMVQNKIYKNWREPLAEEHSQETVLSFFIFSRGNIDKPFIKKSSGVQGLDTLAVKAVLDSAPFPEFPEELKMSNLHINIYFKYVSKDE